MILRTWHGRTKRSDADTYAAFMIKRAAPDYASVDGLVHTYFTRKDDGDVSHFLLVTVWTDMDAVKRFAGADPSKAKYYPEDDLYLLEKENCSHNHDVFLQSSLRRYAALTKGIS